ncbi:MAG: hypothetical protein H7233_17115, partial [Pseudorhodobacter sp.]|nr:hypothetical protein [Frankiaceae bacterium]
MSTVLTTPTATTTTPGSHARRRSPLAWVREHMILLIAGLAFVYLMAPNVVVVLFSFNRPSGRFNYTWQHFSLNAWL